MPDVQHRGVVIRGGLPAQEIRQPFTLPVGVTLFFTFTFTLFQCLHRQNQPKKKLRSSSNADSRGEGFVLACRGGVNVNAKLATTGFQRASERSESAAQRARAVHPLYKFQTTLKSSLVSFARVRPSLLSFEVPAIVGKCQAAR